MQVILIDCGVGAVPQLNRLILPTISYAPVADLKIGQKHPKIFLYRNHWATHAGKDRGLSFIKRVIVAILPSLN